MAASLSMIGLSACGGQSRPQQPVMIVNPWSYDPVTNQDLVAFVGQSNPESFQIQNQGTDDLQITNVTIAPGDGVFTLAQPAPAGPDGGKLTDIPAYPQEVGLIQFYFAPAAKQIYHATITITSNAANDGGVAVLSLEGRGCAPPDGGCADLDGGN